MLFIQIYVQGDEDTLKTMTLHPVRVNKWIVYLSNNFTM